MKLNVKCETPVVVMYRHDGSPVKIKCGEWWGGTRYFCDDCEKRFQKLYPQGWQYTPGDICKHGMYVGGCMEDYICPKCEDGL